MPNFKYLIEQDQDSRWGVVTTTVGHQKIPAGVSYPSGGHPSRYMFSYKRGRVLDEYAVVYITEGKGTFCSAHVPDTAIKPGDIFIVFPGEWHKYRPDPETGWEESWIGFKGPFVENLQKEGFLSPEKPVFSLGFDENIWRLFSMAVEAADRQEVAYQQRLAGYVCMLLSYVYAEDKCNSFRMKGDIPAIDEAKRYLYENFMKTIPMEDVAGHIGMGYSRFRKLFKQYTGFAPAQYVQELRVMKCKELLANTDMTCQEIAYQAGFDSPSYLGLIFHKRTGMTPNEYRRSATVGLSIKNK